MDLHNLPGGVPSQVSQGQIALTFLRSTCPWVEAGKAPMQGRIARMVKISSSYSVLVLSCFTLLQSEFLRVVLGSYL